MKKSFPINWLSSQKDKVLSPLLLGLFAFVVGLSMASCGKEEPPQDITPDTSAINDENIVCDKLFSVSEDQKVYFSPSNLKEGGHGFVNDQYEYGGLFGWGTGNRCDITSTDPYDYSYFADWGSYTPKGPWRTLTSDEWRYLLKGRKDAYSKFGMGMLYGITGLILIPDNWVLPSGCTFRSGTGWWRNHYTLEEWAKMEENGAVFLPTGGKRWGSVVTDKCLSGYYWAADEAEGGMGYAYSMCFSEEYLGVDIMKLPTGCSVRLVKNQW